MNYRYRVVEVTLNSGHKHYDVEFQPTSFCKEDDTWDCIGGHASFDEAKAQAHELKQRDPKSARVVYELE